MLFKCVKDFLELYWREGAPLLVAYSGGPDSKALLYLLLECQKFFNLELHVAHVDHRWREESSFQALELKKEIENLGLPFYLHTLQEVSSQENAAREARYSFFTHLSNEIGAQAIILGHQMEDQAETVLKRVLEGASLPTCGGMKPVSTLEKVTLWRPLLGVAKKDLIQWLDKQGLSSIQDATNLSPQYLRGRLRSSMMPELEASFGKSIIKNLCRLGERAQKLELYLMNQIKPLEDLLDDDQIAIEYLKDLDDLVLEYFLKKWTSRKEIHLSIDQLTLLTRIVRTEDPTLRLHTPSHQLKLSHRVLAIKENL